MKRLIAVVAACALAGCDEIDNERAANPRGVETRALIGASVVKIRTVRHEGHDYVVARNGDGLQMVHSPNCKCEAKDVVTMRERVVK